MKILVVGAGFSGATISWRHLQLGHDVTIVDKRHHVAGNAHTEDIDEQAVHVYGPHIFHTNAKHVWDFVNTFAKFERYTHQVQATTHLERRCSLPFSLLTLQQVFNVQTPAEARVMIDCEIEPFKNIKPDNVESWCNQNIGPTLFRTLIEGYTQKMWNKPCSELPASLVKRLPLRLDNNNADYFDDVYQGIPENGYTKLVEAMVSGAKINLMTACEPETFSSYDKVYYTGQLDQLCNYEFGKLDYRGLRFDRYIVEESQGCAQLNNCQTNEPHTRTTEGWLLRKTPKKPPKIWVVKETPDNNAEPAYPVNDDHNNELHSAYVKLCTHRYSNVKLVGRMATHRYLNMDAAIAQALVLDINP